MISTACGEVMLRRPMQFQVLPQPMMCSLLHISAKACGADVAKAYEVQGATSLQGVLCCKYQRTYHLPPGYYRCHQPMKLQ
eukprot:11199488-Lingulodinium_polyedra.AAC.1